MIGSVLAKSGNTFSGPVFVVLVIVGLVTIIGVIILAVLETKRAERGQGSLLSRRRPEKPPAGGESAK